MCLLRQECVKCWGTFQEMGSTLIGPFIAESLVSGQRGSGKDGVCWTVHWTMKQAQAVIQLPHKQRVGRIRQYGRQPS